jgi:formate dehydrogenase iron-sulfur subunit
MRKGMLVDVSRCIGCRSCQVSCKQWWQLPASVSVNRGTHENPPDLSAYTWNKVVYREAESEGKKRWLFTRKACMHCTDAVCVWVCPTFARGYHPQGFVETDQERCIGCGRCVEYCPFGMPRLGQHDASGRIAVKVSTPRLVSYSCAFCKDRLETGASPACAKACPTQAIRFGNLADLTKEGEARVNRIRSDYPKANLYGKKEMKGLGVLYVLTEEPAAHGLPENPRSGAYATFVKYTFPRWYGKALAERKFAAFPQKANPKWYMQPDLVPAPSPKEPAFIAAFTGTKMGGWAPVLWGWLGVGVIGALGAISWTLRRRRALGKGKESDGA